MVNWQVMSLHGCNGHLTTDKSCHYMDAMANWQVMSLHGRNGHLTTDKSCHYMNAIVNWQLTSHVITWKQMSLDNWQVMSLHECNGHLTTDKSCHYMEANVTWQLTRLVINYMDAMVTWQLTSHVIIWMQCSFHHLNVMLSQARQVLCSCWFASDKTSPQLYDLCEYMHVLNIQCTYICIAAKQNELTYETYFC